MRNCNAVCGCIALIGLLYSPLRAGTTPSDGRVVDESIKVLRKETPTHGEAGARSRAILDMDRLMIRPGAQTDPTIRAFYEKMMEYALAEISQSAPRERTVWAMYNHGFIVREAGLTVAFDLVDGYPPWECRLPDWLLRKIDLLLISHSDGDHYSKRIAEAVMANGKPVLVPSESRELGSLGMDHGQRGSFGGVTVRACKVWHPTPCRLYEVTFPDGMRVVHTGDMNSSRSLPLIAPPDLLLLDCWVNEEGTQPDQVGVANCVRRLRPALTVLGHAQEMGHDYNPADVTGRRPYRWSLEAQKVVGADRIKVLMWGERLLLPSTPPTSAVPPKVRREPVGGS